MEWWWIVLGVFVFSTVCATVAVANEDDFGASDDEPVTVCQVDSTFTPTTPGYGVTAFTTVREAIDADNCQAVYIRHANKDAYFE